MTMRTTSLMLLGLLALTACSKPKAVAMQPTSEGGSDGVPCQVAGEKDFDPVCAIDVMGDVIVVRQPDGGFRRFRITDDGKGVAAADGAERAKVTVTGDRQIEVAIGGNRYLLPATLKGAPAPKP